MSNNFVVFVENAIPVITGRSRVLIAVCHHPGSGIEIISNAATVPVKKFELASHDDYLEIHIIPGPPGEEYEQLPVGYSPGTPVSFLWNRSSSPNPLPRRSTPHGYTIDVPQGPPHWYLKITCPPGPIRISTPENVTVGSEGPGIGKGKKEKDKDKGEDKDEGKNKDVDNGNS